MTMRRCIVALTMALLATAPRDAGAAGAGQTCGGIAGVRCDDGFWCQLPDGMCSVSDLQGVCRRAGTVCTTEYRPVCGCNGRTYGNDCHLRIERGQKRHDGACR